MLSANAAPLAIALLGLLLGMRHATDPDHVIAVTTILSRERRLVVAARIGVVWGLGHTLTVLLVGAAIIVFKIAIPVRLGLAMDEFEIVRLCALDWPEQNRRAARRPSLHFARNNVCTVGWIDRLKEPTR